MTRRAARGELSHCGEVLWRGDRDRFLFCLFAPPDRREALFALYAFNLELARTAESVSDPMLGRIRLQWWREAVAGIYAGAPRRHATVEALARVVAEHGLDRDRLDAAIDAREADLEERGPETVDALLAYLDATGGAMLELALSILSDSSRPRLNDDLSGSGLSDNDRIAATQIGRAYGLAGILAASLPLVRRRRVLIPADLLRRSGATPETVLAGRPHPGLSAAALAMASVASDALRTGKAAARGIPRATRKALLPGVVAAHRLRAVERFGGAVLDPEFALAAARRPTLRLLVASWLG